MIGPLELSANVDTAVSIMLAGCNSGHTWWTGIVGCALFGAFSVIAQFLLMQRRIENWPFWLLVSWRRLSVK